MASLEERFAALSFDDLNRFVADRQEENLHVEFKTVADAALSNADDRRNLARAVSGFANSEGGLVVWGVVARKDGQGVDCAESLKPIPNVARLLSRLNELTGDATSPTVPGVQHRIVGELDDGAGYAITMVPVSDTGPHMAKLSVDQYFKRAGDSFLKMEHFDIADMFGRRPKPALHFRFDVYQDGLIGTIDHPVTQMYRAVGSLENVGRGSAVAPYLAVDVRAPYQVSAYGVDGNGNFGLPRLVSAGSFSRFGASANVVLHPGVTIEVFSVRGKFDVTDPKLEPIQIDYAFAATDVALTTGTAEVLPAAILAGTGRA